MRAMIVLLGVIGVVAFLVAGVARRVAPEPGRVAAGALAPDFTLPQVNGGSFRLRERLGRPVVLAFIMTNSSGAERSRSQLVFLKSMATQYGPQRLTVIAIAAGPAEANSSDLINFTYDHALPFPLLAQGAPQDTARVYGITDYPTTLLIDKSGVVVRRWNGFVGPADLALAIGALVQPR